MGFDGAAGAQTQIPAAPCIWVKLFWWSEHLASKRLTADS